MSVTAAQQLRTLGTVLVTGATGFVGRRVLDALAGRDDVDGVYVATRRAASGQAFPWHGFKCVTLDLSLDIALPPGVRTVIHLAGEKRDSRRMQEINCDGARRLAEAAARAGTATFVHLSSVGVYGAPYRSGRVDEDFPHRPANPYEISKDRGEAAVLVACRQAGIECIVLQPSNVIGYEPGRSLPLLGLVRAIRRGRLLWFGDGNGWVNYVDRRDTACAIVTAATHASPGAAYIINTPAPLAETVGWIASECGVAYPRRRLPLWVGRGLGAVGSFVARLSRRGMPFDSPRFRELTNDTVYDGQRLVSATGLQYPVGAESAIRELARRYMEERLA